MSAKDKKFKVTAMFILCISSLFIFAGCGAKSSDMGKGNSGENSGQVENNAVPEEDSQKKDASGAAVSQGENADGGISGNDNADASGAGINNAGADSASGNNSDSSAGNGVLSEDKIKEIVLEDANIALKDAFFMKVRLEREDGVLVYDVEFYVGDKEYEYSVDPVTGKILEKEIENKHD